MIKQEKNYFPVLILLKKDELYYIDDLVTEMKRTGGGVISRSSFIRATIRAIRRKEINTKGLIDEDQLTERIAADI